MISKKKLPILKNWTNDVEFDWEKGSLESLGWTFYWDSVDNIRKKTKKFAPILQKIDGKGRIKLKETVEFRNLMSISGKLFDQIQFSSGVLIQIGAPWHKKRYAAIVQNEVFMTNNANKLIDWLNGKD